MEILPAKLQIYSQTKNTKRQGQDNPAPLQKN
jgi:hypothetical protein